MSYKVHTSQTILRQFCGAKLFLSAPTPSPVIGSSPMCCVTVAFIIGLLNNSEKRPEFSFWVVNFGSGSTQKRSTLIILWLVPEAVTCLSLRWRPRASPVCPSRSAPCPPASTRPASRWWRPRATYSSQHSPPRPSEEATSQTHVAFVV